MEARHPLSDRRIVEFGLALPENQLRRDGTNKFILRNAGRNLLPSSVLSRRDKAHFAEMFSDQLRALGGESLFDSLSIARLGWVNADKLRLMYKQMEKFSREGFKGPVTYIWILWTIFGIELWWRSVFERKNCGSLNQNYNL
jgi:asparagine synthetase B (glutamine-hydrolysing)